jgi:hypothetical protein
VRTYVGCIIVGRVHTRVAVIKSVYKIIQVSTGAVSTTCYFLSRLSSLRDGSSKFES